MDLDNFIRDNDFFKIANNKPLVLFGASNFGKNMLDYLQNKNIEVDFFCDNDSKKWGEDICGIRVISFDSLCNIDKNANVLITSMYFNPIYLQLKNHGFSNIYTYSNFFCLVIIKI